MAAHRRRSSRSGAAGAAPQNVLTAREQADGWRLLFDGTTTTGWKGFAKPAFPTQGWVVEDGTLKGLGKKGGDIITTSAYGDFEFAWDWRLSFQGNSGIKYFVDETARQRRRRHRPRVPDDRR